MEVSPKVKVSAQLQKMPFPWPLGLDLKQHSTGERVTSLNQF